MARKIVVTSGKGGVGKTTVTVNLGVALSNLGQKVVLVDADFGLNNLDVVMGVENKIDYDIVDVIDGRCRLKQALVNAENHKNLFVLSSGSNVNSCISGQNVKLVIENLSKYFDYVLIDCPAGIDLGFHRAVSCVDEAIIIATPNITSLRDVDKVISVLKSYRLSSINLVVNKTRGDLILNEQVMSPKDIEKVLKTNLIGVLPEEDVVFLSSGFSLPKRSESAKAYRILANNVHNNTKKIYDTTFKYSGFFGSVRRRLKNIV